MSADARLALTAKMRSCRLCEPLQYGAKPVFQWGEGARLAVFAQAPGIRAHNSGRPFTDPSGDRLRAWMGIDNATFYDDRQVMLLPMAFCFPGHDAKGGDLPPRKECAATWRPSIMAHALPKLDLALIVGSYALAWHLPEHGHRTMTDSVADWRSVLSAPPRHGQPKMLPLPHPSWRNTAWLRRNPWFEAELVPVLQAEIRRVLQSVTII